jgi:hypothetical protein
MTTSTFDDMWLNSSFAPKTTTQDHAESGHLTALSDANRSMLPPAKPRKKKAPTLRESDWEPYKDRITKLYASKTSLKVVKEILEAETAFSAE